MSSFQEKPKYQNEHNVHVRSGMATLRQLELAVIAFKKSLANYTCSDSDLQSLIRSLAKYEIEATIVTEGTENRSKCFGYLWAEKPEVYHILCGKNPDGSKREKVIYEDNNKEFDFDDIENMDFNDMMTDTKQTGIVTKLEPLIQFPGYKYTKEQADVTYTYLCEKERQDAEKEGRDVRPIEYVENGYFELSPSTTCELADNQKSSILIGDVPKWVTVDMIASKFKKFASNLEEFYEVPTQSVRNDFFGRYKSTTFSYSPKFKIVMTEAPVRHNPEWRMVLIEYPLSGSATGIFAIQLRRKTKFVNPRPVTGQEKEATCIFNFFKNNPQKETTESRRSDSNSFPKREGFTRNNDFVNRAVTTPTSGSGDDGFTTIGSRRR
jgi:hypothetical protein